MRLLLHLFEQLLLAIVHLGDAVYKPIGRWLDGHPQSRWWFGVMRLGLFQFGVGLSLAPITGTLNRVLITDLAIPAVAVGFLIALHYFVSPVRALIGYHSDVKRSEGKWRTPYVVLGVLLTYAGLATAPFALIILSGDGALSFWPAMIVCTAIFLAYGVGINVVETIYLALVSDITPPKMKGKVIALLWLMLILGTVVSAVVVSALLTDYSHRRLIEVMQGAAIIFVVLTVISLWRQERLRPDGSIISVNQVVRVRLSLWESVKMLGRQRVMQGLFFVIFIAMMAFATHDVLLEPYGGQVLGMSVSATMALTALWGAATVVGVLLAAVLIWRKQSPALLIGLGSMIGFVGFGVISMASNVAGVEWFRMGVGLVSLGRGLFLVGSVFLVMTLADVSHAGLFLGVWGIVQALAQGIGIIGGGLMRDLVQLATGDVALGYTMVYTTALALLLSVAVIVVFSLGRHLRVNEMQDPWAGLEEIPADQLAF